MKVTATELARQLTVITDALAGGYGDRFGYLAERLEHASQAPTKSAAQDTIMLITEDLADDGLYVHTDAVTAFVLGLAAANQKEAR